MPSCELIIVSLSTPLIIGVYENGELKDELKSEKQSSDALIELLAQLKNSYKIKRIIYANGPGSFMGLKISYVILRIFCDINNIAFGAISAFSLTQNAAVSAKKGFCFVLEKDKISIQKGQGSPFLLPKTLENLNISKDALPNYVLDAL